MKDGSCLGPYVDCYNIACVVIETDAVVSQYAFLCTGSHDYEDESFPLISAPIVVGREAWIAAAAYIGPGVTVGEGAVVAARAAVVRNIASWTVVAGNPAREVKKRKAR